MRSFIFLSAARLLAELFYSEKFHSVFGRPVCKHFGVFVSNLRGFTESILDIIRHVELPAHRLSLGTAATVSAILVAFL